MEESESTLVGAGHEPAPDPQPEPQGFDTLGLDAQLLEGIGYLGYKAATQIQLRAIPHILAGRDLIGCAQTGTGKTAAYLLPTLHRLMQQPARHSRVLIVCPTRELALQIDQSVEALAYFTSAGSVAVYGGKDKDGWDRQKAGIVGGADIIVATPGRLLMHANLGYLKLNTIETLILDEADKMLDMGFMPDIERIVGMLPAQRQTLMFSATMPAKIKTLAKKLLRDPEEVIITLAKPAAGIAQSAYLCFDHQKIPLLEHVVRTRTVESMIIFASSKIMVNRLAAALDKLGYGVRSIHSDKEQSEREQTLQAFRNRQFQILVGTDVLSRGIDIEDLSHVLNFDCPPDAEDYVHRIGRTARAAAKGEAITFVNPQDMYRLAQIERLIGYPVPKGEIPADLGEGPAFDPDARPPRRGGPPGQQGGGFGAGKREHGRDSSRQGHDRPPRTDRPPRAEGDAPARKFDTLDRPIRPRRDDLPSPGEPPAGLPGALPGEPQEAQAAAKKKKKKKKRKPTQPDSPIAPHNAPPAAE